ncbi:cytochrome P450 [Catenuloplanes nepalensis]|uniref:Cytochrome P450 n=1 Tax=Catenuloplanes nepalensis TaxID=587533 RepID=A0ABT9MQV3_9ACTN|nr:cytochrome P450 [Catenuloplanes nepalensis]MDP9793795.1 cytochrome P450 [Catenuloplanes nepalensis]
MAVLADRFDPADPELRVDPYPIYRRFREADPVHWGLSSLAGFPGAWYIFRHDDVVSILRDSRFGKERPATDFATADARPERTTVPEAARTFFGTARQWVVHRDPPDHTRLRDLLRPHFAPAAVARLRPRIAAIAADLLDGIARRGGGDLIADYAYPLPVAVIAEMIGLPADGRDLLVECSRHWQAVDVSTTDETWRGAGDAIDAARDYLRVLVRRRDRGTGDLIDVLAGGRDTGEVVSEDELLANIMFLFVAGAGFQTTTGLIGSGLHLLLSDREQWDRLADRPGLLPSAIDEALRYEPPVQTTNRIAREAVTVGGRTIGAGDSVLVVFAAANRDPAVFPDPDRFDITRTGRANHSFGVGIHYCLGGPLAAVEAEIAIGALRTRLPGLRPAGPAAWNPMVSLRVLQTLPVAC